MKKTKVKFNINGTNFEVDASIIEMKKNEISLIFPHPVKINGGSVVEISFDLPRGDG